MALQLDWSIKIGDILTSVTIFISVVALLLSLSKDRDAKLTDQANQVRSAAATAVTKLDRWQALQLSLYQELQPTFIELSEILAKKYDVAYVRDQLWKKVNIERTRIAQKVLDEQLGTGYSDLISHFPAARSKFTDAFAQLNEVERTVTDSYLAASEQEILKLEGMQKMYTTPTLGNALREAAKLHSAELRTRSETVIAPLREYLFGVIVLPDSQIVSAAVANKAANPSARTSRKEAV